MRKVTIQEVAEAAGVSKSTMSRYLNQNYSHMSVSTRQRIEKTVKALAYRPSRRAQSLKTKRSRLIGIMIADISNVYVSLLLKGITNYLKQYDYQTLIMESGNSVEQERQQLDQMLDQSVEGIILQPNSRLSATYQFIADAEVPLVLVDRETAPFRWDTIETDNYQATSRLSAQVHQSAEAYTVGLVVSEDVHAISTREQRLAGFINGVAPLPVQTVELDASNAAFTQKLQTLLAANEHPLVFANNGKVLAVVLKTLQALSLRVPRDVGVAGYDDWNWAGLVGPGISTVEQHPDKIGYLAGEMLMKLVQPHEKKPKPAIHTLPASVKFRQSI